MLPVLFWGVISVLITATVITILLLSVKWLIGKVKERIQKHKDHKVAFVDSHVMLNEYITEKAAEAESISMAELERYCDEKPFIIADVDKSTGELSDYEAIRPEEVADDIDDLLYQNDGLILIEE